MGAENLYIENIFPCFRFCFLALINATLLKQNNICFGFENKYKYIRCVHID